MNDYQQTLTAYILMGMARFDVMSMDEERVTYHFICPACGLDLVRSKDRSSLNGSEPPFLAPRFVCWQCDHGFNAYLM